MNIISKEAKEILQAEWDKTKSWFAEVDKELEESKTVCCEICNNTFQFDGVYRMGALVCTNCNEINREYLDDYWKKSISGQLREMQISGI